MQKNPNNIVTQDSQSWAQGASDGFQNREKRDPVADPLAYASGRIEGEAWREQGRDLAAELKRTAPRTQTR